MELYVYRYSKPSRKQEREREREPLPVPAPAPSHAVIPGPPTPGTLYPYSIVGGKRCLPEINTLWKNVDAGAAGKTCDAG